MYRFVSIPFEERSSELYKLWKCMAQRYIEGDSITMENSEFQAKKCSVCKKVLIWQYATFGRRYDILVYGVKIRGGLT